jgi:hypothetical protein
VIIALNAKAVTRCFKRLQSTSIVLIIFLACHSRIHGLVGYPKNTASKLVESVDFDWDHSGKPTHFSLSSQQSNSADNVDIFTIQRAGIKLLTLRDVEGGWGTVATLVPRLKHRNLATSSHMFFMADGPASDARIYLILVGEGSSCCVGSLTVLTPDKDGMPRTVFHENRGILFDVRPLEDSSGLQLITKSSDSEAWALENAQTYDPFRIYLLKDTSPAKYDLELSKAYTVLHYCQWAGPDYDEKFGAIQVAEGPRNCRTMTRVQFQLYSSKHPTHFPQD